MNPQEQNSIILQLGKNKITPPFLENVKKNLANNKLVKIKFLKNAMDGTNRKELANQVLQELNLQLEHKLIGNVLFLKRIKN